MKIEMRSGAHEVAQDQRKVVTLHAHLRQVHAGCQATHADAIGAVSGELIDARLIAVDDACSVTQGRDLHVH